PRQSRLDAVEHPHERGRGRLALRALAVGFADGFEGVAPCRSFFRSREGAVSVRSCALLPMGGDTVPGDTIPSLGSAVQIRGEPRVPTRPEACDETQDLGAGFGDARTTPLKATMGHAVSPGGVRGAIYCFNLRSGAPADKFPSLPGLPSFPQR